MISKKIIAGVIAVNLLCYGGQVFAVEFSGRVTDANGIPLINATVLVRGSDIQVKTDSEGAYSLNLPAGEYTIDIEAGDKAHFHEKILVKNEKNSSHKELSLEHDTDHKIVITANPLEHTILDMATPAVVIAGDDLTLKKSGTLGDILMSQPGINISSFGPAVSRPVIRGLSGGRVQVTINQMNVQDISATSADHDVSIEPLLAEQIEVLKGPATLIYGSGAIGGVINLTDRKINPNGSEDLEGGIEIRMGDSTTSEKTMVFTVDGGRGDWLFHLDGYKSETSDLKIPSFAESERLRQLEIDTGGIEEEEVSGILPSSGSESQGGSLGATQLTNWGYIGASVSHIAKLYDIPGHAHGDNEGVSIDMKQTRYDLQSRVDEPLSGIKQWFTGISFTEYKHDELEGLEIGTHFDNEAWELRSFVKHQPINDWFGVIGFQFNQRDFSAIGDEAFVPITTTNSWAAFFMEEKEFADFKLELGLRYEYRELDSEGFNKISDGAISSSIGGVYSLGTHNKLAANFSVASRFAAVEELHAFGPHPATQTFEIGNQNLDSERSQNFDVSWRFEVEQFNGEINLYYNKFSDFIFAANKTDVDSCVSTEAAIEAQTEGLQLVCYEQQDATFYGMEMQLNYLLVDDSDYQISLGMMADSVNAELDSGEPLPRIPPIRYGLDASLEVGELTAAIEWIHTTKQEELAENESVTDAFDSVVLEVAQRFYFEENELFVFIKGKNLLDEEARDHTSFLKELAPRAGRSWLLGARYSF